MDYVGIWNETPYDTAWIKLLRKTLDRAGLKAVKIVAADEVNAWTIADKIKADPELAAAIQVVYAHYPNYVSTAAAKECGKPLWSTEDCLGSPARLDRGQDDSEDVQPQLHPGQNDQDRVWAMIDSYYGNLPWPGCGMITGQDALVGTL